jgi:hypothetical protein
LACATLALTGQFAKLQFNRGQAKLITPAHHGGQHQTAFFGGLCRMQNAEQGPRAASSSGLRSVYFMHAIVL